MITITNDVTLVVETCCNCGTPFAMEEGLHKSRKQTKETFYCPNGHPQHYTGESAEATIKRLERNVRAETERADWWKGEAESKAAQLKSTRSALTKTKNRIAKGICPCCHRQFVDLQRHMAGQHPEYNGEME